MPSMLRLDLLRQLRMARKMSQSEAARLCGLQGRQSYQTFAKWEQGTYIPNPAQRAGMMRYLWDGLRLRDDPATFEEVWAVLVDEWKWEPIGEGEWADFLGQPRPSPLRKSNRALSPTKSTTEAAFPSPPEAGSLPERSGTKELTLPLDKLPAPASLPTGSKMPLSRNPFFVGRDQDLLALAAALSQEQTAAISPVETAAATGLGGIGKTQLASEFVHRYGQFFPGGVFWLSFENTSAIPAQIAACGAAGGMDLRSDFAMRPLEEQVGLVQAAWQEPVARLLVFDNCEEQELVAQWRPVSGGCRIIITSRRGEWDPVLNVQHLPLAVFARHESITLLRRHCPEAEEAVLNAIADELGDLPLALHLAGSYLYRYRRAITPEQYLTSLRTSTLLHHPSFDSASISPTAHVQHVGRTFALSYERLNPANPLDELALRLLTHMAAFAPGEPVWYDVLVRTLDLDPGQPDEKARAEDAFARLIELGLIQVEDKVGMRVHRLVAAFVQEMSPDASIVGRRKVESTVLASLRLATDKEMPLTLLPGDVHMRFVVDAALADEPLWGATVAMSFGRYLWQMGDFASARTYLERALNVRRTHLGEEAVETVAAHFELGFVLREMNELELARVNLEQAVAIREKLLGEDHADTADALHELGMLYKYMGKADAALATLQRAYTIFISTAGMESLLTAEAAVSLGLMWIDGYNEVHKALELFEEALQICHANALDEHMLTALIYHNIGYARTALEELTEAKAAYSRALAMRRALVTEEHGSALLTQSMLGGVLTRLGEVDEAHDLLLQAVELSRRVLGEIHPVTATSHTQLGLNYQVRGDFIHAKFHLQIALQMLRTLFGEPHRRVANVLELLGKLAIEEDDWPTARDYLWRTLVMREQFLAHDHPSIVALRAMIAQGDATNPAL